MKRYNVVRNQLILRKTLQENIVIKYSYENPDLAAKDKPDWYYEQCKYALVKYKPWVGAMDNAWKSANENDPKEYERLLIEFGNTKAGKYYLPQILLNRVADIGLNVELEFEEEDNELEEDYWGGENWMVISHQKGKALLQQDPYHDPNFDWTTDFKKFDETTLKQWETFIQREELSAQKKTKKMRFFFNERCVCKHYRCRMCNFTVII